MCSSRDYVNPEYEQQPGKTDCDFRNAFDELFRAITGVFLACASRASKEAKTTYGSFFLCQSELVASEPCFVRTTLIKITFDNQRLSTQKPLVY
jgi:hypothetical protein